MPDDTSPVMKSAGPSGLHRIEFGHPEASDADTRGTRWQACSRIESRRRAFRIHHRVRATSGGAAVSGQLAGCRRHHRAGAARFRKGGSARSPQQRRPVSGHRAPKNLRLLAKPSKRSPARSSVFRCVLDEGWPSCGTNDSGEAAASKHHPRSSRQAPTPGNHTPNTCGCYLRRVLPREWNSARKSGAISTVSPGALGDRSRSNNEPPL
jgi:hypothetical protein